MNLFLYLSIILILVIPKVVFAYRYVVDGTVIVANKTEADSMKVDLAALSPITEPDKLEIIQKAEVNKTAEEKATGKEYISLEIVFTDDKEAGDYFNTALGTISGEGSIRKHKCMHVEKGELENKSCTEIETLILK